MRWALNPMTEACVRERRGRFGYRHTEEAPRRRSCKDGGRDWRDAATGQETPRIAGNCRKLEESKEAFSPRAFRKSTAC